MILNQIKLGKKFNDEYTLTLKLYVCENNEIFISKEDEIIYQINAVNRKQLTPGSKEV